jgi:hypothetical protein
MVAPADRRVAWHPRHTSKFAVGGGTNVASYEWSLDDESIRHVTSYDDLQHMKVRGVILFACLSRSSVVTAIHLTVLCMVS